MTDFLFFYEELVEAEVNDLTMYEDAIAAHYKYAISLYSNMLGKQLGSNKYTFWVKHYPGLDKNALKQVLYTNLGSHFQTIKWFVQAHSPSNNTVATRQQLHDQLPSTIPSHLKPSPNPTLTRSTQTIPPSLALHKTPLPINHQLQAHSPSNNTVATRQQLHDQLPSTIPSHLKLSPNPTLTSSTQTVPPSLALHKTPFPINHQLQAHSPSNNTVATRQQLHDQLPSTIPSHLKPSPNPTLTRSTQTIPPSLALHKTPLPINHQLQAHSPSNNTVATRQQLHDQLPSTIPSYLKPDPNPTPTRSTQTIPPSLALHKTPFPITHQFQAHSPSNSKLSTPVAVFPDEIYSPTPMIPILPAVLTHTPMPRQPVTPITTVSPHPTARRTVPVVTVQ
ncbi:mucin-2-like [Macrosteles quadrilineatus]|uniref:mucin-2-like n=1 Tax=Macrosteles quadrilineatus TaxID=74068 RepID=UPI0023E24BD0|nr:mucin-2-like [Macrosteles quadrilineatus]